LSGSLGPFTRKGESRRGIKRNVVILPCPLFKFATGGYPLLSDPNNFHNHSNHNDNPEFEANK